MNNQKVFSAYRTVVAVVKLVIEKSRTIADKILRVAFPVCSTTFLAVIIMAVLDRLLNTPFFTTMVSGMENPEFVLAAATWIHNTVNVIGQFVRDSINWFCALIKSPYCNSTEYATQYYFFFR